MARAVVGYDPAGRGVATPQFTAFGWLSLPFPTFPAARGADRKRQNSLSCAHCCAAL